MTLHEAIQHVLKQEGKPLSASEIAENLNQNSLYLKGNGSKIKGSQISARINKYPHLFAKSDGNISLNSITNRLTLKTRKPSKNKVSIESSNDTKALAKTLMNSKKFRAIPDVENKIPDMPGLYCIRIVNTKLLKTNFANVLQQRNHNIIYIGLASKSLKKRFLGQELRAKGHGSFFRSLGAVLGYTPEKGSLRGMTNQNNYKFSPEHQKKIIEWINKNLLVNWVEVEEGLNDIENELLRTYSPLLNLTGNPGKLIEVTQMRDKCKRVARGSY